MLSISERARRYVQKCPPAISGQRGHDQAFHVAVILVHWFGLSESEAMVIFREWNASCVPEWSESELAHKITSAASASHSMPRGWLLGERTARGQRTENGGQTSPHLGPLSSAATVAKAAFVPAVLKRVATKIAAVGDIVRFISERSPVRVETQDSASVLRRLYLRGSGEKVLIFSEMETQGQMVWEADKSDVIQNSHLPVGPDGVWFLPQPVDGEYHPNPRLNGKMSRRSEESVTAWRFAVLESDKADADDWLRCLVQMPLRIACISDSGGRSIHALVRVDAASKKDWDKQIAAVKPLLVTLGADNGALTAVRLSRLPHAKRGERVQRLLYLNTQPGGVPILKLPTQEVLYGRKWGGGEPGDA